MEIAKIKQLRVFEKMVTACILKEFHNYLKSEKKSQLSENTLIPDNYDNEFTSAENIQGEIFRLVLSKVFENILCKKEFSFSDGTNSIIEYGNFLHEGLVIYFSEAISLKYNIAIDEVNNSEEKIVFIKQIRESLEDNFKPLVFNCDANTILNIIGKDEITKVCDSDAVKRYLKQKNDQKVIENEDNAIIISEKNEEQKERTLPIKDENQLNKPDDELLVYTNKEEETLYNDFSDISETDLIEEEQKTKLTDDKGNIRLITTDEYTRICMKSVNGKDVTPEELKLLEYYDNYYFNKENKDSKIISMESKRKPQKHKVTNIKKDQLVPKRKLKNAGFTRKFIPVLVILGIIILGIICGMALFNLNGK